MLPAGKRLDGRISFWLAEHNTYALLGYSGRDHNSRGWYHNYDLIIDRKPIHRLRVYDNGALDVESLTHYVGLCLAADYDWNWDTLIPYLVTDWLLRD